LVERDGSYGWGTGLLLGIGGHLVAWVCLIHSVDPARVNELDKYEDGFMAQAYAHEYEKMENAMLDESWVDDLWADGHIA